MVLLEQGFNQIDLFFDFGTLSERVPSGVSMLPDRMEYGLGLFILPPPSEYVVQVEISDYHSPFWEILLAFARGKVGYKVPFLLSHHKSGSTIEGVVYTPHDLYPPVLQQIDVTASGLLVSFEPQTIEFKVVGQMTARWPAPSQDTLVV